MFLQSFFVLTYAFKRCLVHPVTGLLSVAWLCGAGMNAHSAMAAQAQVHIVCLGDSLTAGYQLPADAAFPVVLEKALRAHGLHVEAANAGVSGDTSSGGLERLDWSVPEGTDIVIVELGANDMLRGIDPKVTQTALNTILARLQSRQIRVLLAGMRATPSLGKDFQSRFDAVFPDLSEKFQVPLYPFFLEGVAGQAGMQLADGLHPSRAGVELIVKRILPSVEAIVRAPSAAIKP